MLEKLKLVNSLDTSKFYVIVAVTNPIRFYSRARLFHQFRKHIMDLGANLVVIEAAYGARPHAIATNKTQFGLTPPVASGCGHHTAPHMHNQVWGRPDGQWLRSNDMNQITFGNNSIGPVGGINPPDVMPHPNTREFHIQVRTESEIWHKENLINLAIQQLCHFDPDWKYVAWIDADISFVRQDIILETAQQLQHYDIVQMFSHAIDLDPDMQIIQQLNGFMWSYHENQTMPPQGAGYGGYYGGYGTKGKFWHCGYAWAMRRAAAEKMMLFDKAILGSADHHMAMALIGCYERSVPTTVTKAYKQAVKSWQDMADKAIARNVGYVPGTIFHHWHGKKTNRKYVDRWKIMVDNKFNPNTDISRDPQGLYKINMNHGPRSIKLRDDIRRYFRQRHEDSIDVE